MRQIQLFRQGHARGHLAHQGQGVGDVGGGALLAQPLQALAEGVTFDGGAGQVGQVAGGKAGGEHGRDVGMADLGQGGRAAAVGGAEVSIRRDSGKQDGDLDRPFRLQVFAGVIARKASSFSKVWTPKRSICGAVLSATTINGYVPLYSRCRAAGQSDRRRPAQHLTVAGEVDEQTYGSSAAAFSEGNAQRVLTFRV